MGNESRGFELSGHIIIIISLIFFFTFVLDDDHITPLHPPQRESEKGTSNDPHLLQFQKCC